MKIRKLLNNIISGGSLITIPCKFNRCKACDNVLYGKINFEGKYCNLICALDGVKNSYENNKPLRAKENNINDNFKKILNINLKKLNNPKYLK